MVLVIHPLAVIICDKVLCSVIVPGLKRLFVKPVSKLDQALSVTSHEIAEYARRHPEVLAKPVWQAAQKLRDIISNPNSGSILTAESIADVVKHMNSTELIIIGKGLIQNEIIIYALRVGMVVGFVMVIRNYRKILKFTQALLSVDNESIIDDVLVTKAVLELISKYKLSNPFIGNKNNMTPRESMLRNSDSANDSDLKLVKLLMEFLSRGKSS
jgi:hypothetical protein